MLRARNNGTNITKSGDGERNCLQEKVDEVVVLPIHKIIASAEK